MSRIAPAPAEQYEPIYGANPPVRLQVYAQAPEMARAYAAFGAAQRQHSTLPPRLIELVRLRVAFHNQCRTCMSVRYQDAADDGVNEALVCSLERPEEAPDLTDAEKAAIELADRMATDHLSVDDATFTRLRLYFNDAELMQLGFALATFVGFGRLGAVLDMVDDLPEEYADQQASLAPWRQAPASYIG
jgi:AhpD family alkylhydroperoxidase